VNAVKKHQRELLVGLLVSVALYAFSSLVLGDLEQRLSVLSRSDGLPARSALVAKVRRAEADARAAAARMDAIRAAPLTGPNLPSTLERLFREPRYTRIRPSLFPRTPQPLTEGIQQEEVDVTINALSLAELIDVLTQLETLGPAVRIRSLRIQKYVDTVTLMMTVAALRVPERS
jgi:hypothetical protein